MNLSDIRSLGYRTDLSLLRAGNSVIEPADGMLIVRSPDEPTFHWGNFLLLQRVPSHGDLGRWLERFAAAFPGAAHVALGVDEPSGQTETGSDELGRYGLTLSRDVVLTCRGVPEPPRPNKDADLRLLESEQDWQALFDLRVAIDGSPSGEHREFLWRRVRAGQRLASEGRVAWFGAFDGGQLVASAGIGRTDDGVARYQSVGTHPDHRRRGLAASLVSRAGEYALDEHGARALVIVADADSAALQLYRSLGFEQAEFQVGIESSE